MNIINFYSEQEPKDSKYYSLFVDITHRCNMECANCYIPVRDVPDLDINKFYNALAQFPQKTEIRLIGGEPTVRTDLVEIVAKIKELGHRPTMMTNGLMLARPGYARELVDAGMRSIYISMNGADDDDVYEVMDGTRENEAKRIMGKFGKSTKIPTSIKKTPDFQIPDCKIVYEITSIQYAENEEVTHGNLCVCRRSGTHPRQEGVDLCVDLGCIGYGVDFAQWENPYPDHWRPGDGHSDCRRLR